MINLTSVNSIIIIIYLVFRLACLINTRIELKIESTFWEKKPYGFGIWLWKYPRKCGHSNSGKLIFGFNWRNSEKITDDIKKKRSRS